MMTSIALVGTALAIEYDVPLKLYQFEAVFQSVLVAPLQITFPEEGVVESEGLASVTATWLVAEQPMPLVTVTT